MSSRAESSIWAVPAFSMQSLLKQVLLMLWLVLTGEATGLLIARFCAWVSEGTCTCRSLTSA